jgi:Tol biopolymer transport system component
MRTYLVAVAVAAALGAAAPGPEKIVFSRVFPQPGQIGLFIAAADGSDERPLLASPDIDYDAVWSPDGASIVFTSERSGSADLYRVKADGSGLEQLTDNPAYDDQAAFSPDGKQLVFVTTRNGGTSDLWTIDLQTRRAKALTSGPGGDFRPSWSPDGKWIVFSSDRESNLPFAHGRWEHLHLVDLYVVRPDGSGQKRITEHGNFCGSPKWSTDSRRVLAYCMTAEQTLDDRRALPERSEDTRLVSIDVATGVASNLPTGPGVKFNPSFLPAEKVGFIRKDAADPGIFYSNGTRGPKGQIRTASWSPDGSRVVFHKRVAFTRKPWVKTFSRNPDYELTLTAMQPSFSPSGERFAVVAGAGADNLGAGVAVATSGGDKSEVIYQDKTRNVLGPQWSPRGDTIIFGIGVFNAFFNGFHGLFLKPEDRAEGGAQIAMINADGSGFRELTAGPNNNGFPSMSPDGKRVVYRSFGPEGDGLRIMNVETKTSTMLSKGYDNFPLWSPRADLIMFSRLAEGNYEIYTIRPDGTGVTRLTNARGNDAHMAWSPDGEFIVFASTRMGFKDEMTYTDAPQPYGEIFVMRYDGTNVQQLTDNQWEDGTPAWQPTRPRSSSSQPR